VETSTSDATSLSRSRGDSLGFPWEIPLTNRHHCVNPRESHPRNVRIRFLGIAITQEATNTSGRKGVRFYLNKNIYIYICVCIYMYVDIGGNLDLRKYASLNKNTRISMIGPIRLVDYLFTAPGSLRPRASACFATREYNSKNNDFCIL